MLSVLTCSSCQIPFKDRYLHMYICNYEHIEVQILKRRIILSKAKG